MSRRYWRPYLWLISAVSLFIPRRFRAGWKQEWEAELLHREETLTKWRKKAGLDLFKHSTGSFWDALWLQPRRLEEDMFQDLRYGARMMWKTPAFTVVVVLTLALGIGANTAIFSVVNAVLLRSLPYHQADELEMFYFTNAQGDEEWFVTSAAYQDLKRQSSAFTDIAAWGNSTWPANLTGDGEAERLQGFQISPNFFQVLGVTAEHGRTFLPEEDRFGQANVVVMSHELWQRRFGGQQDVIGRSILLNGTPYHVIGVMPPDFRFILKTDVWAPLTLPATSGVQNDADLQLLFRRRSDVSTEAARAQIENILGPHVGNSSSNLRGHLKPLQTVLTVGERQMLTILFAAVGFVLLIACANVANLLLARASNRGRELAIRGALGAGRWRIVRQLLVESTMLAVFGGACGLLLANWCIRLLIGGLPESVAAKNSHVAMLGLDGWALGYTFVLSGLTTIIFGLIPALRTSKVSLNEALKEGGRGDSPGRWNTRFRSLLVVTEIALASVLLTGAGLMIKSFWQLSNVNRGFDSAGVLTAKIDPSSDRYRDSQQIVVFYQQALERISAIPSVQHAGIVNNWDYGWRVEVEAEAPIPEEQRPLAARYPVSVDYFKAMRIPLRSGRFFSDRDLVGAPPVVIIDETLARRHFPNSNPIGKHLKFQDALREIVGIVGATKNWRPYSFGRDEDFPRVYLPYQQFSCDGQKTCWSMSLIVRSQSGDPMSLLPAIRRELAAVDKNQPIHSFKLLEQSVSELSADRRFSTLLLAAFAALAVLLAVVGIYGVMSYTVVQRTHEIGIRLALGAQRSDVLKMVIGRGLLLAFSGISIGLIASLALARVLASLLYRVSANDPLTIICVSILLICIALLACYIPARRAAKVDPLVALRYE